MAHRLSDREYQRIMNSPDVQRVIEAKAEAIRDETRKRVTVRSGEARDSVVVESAIRDDGVHVRRVGYDLDVSDHGPYWEFGTEDTAPHPTLRAAAKSVK
jgi:HK97 gp10 family phage protein